VHKFLLFIAVGLLIVGFLFSSFLFVFKDEGKNYPGTTFVGVTANGNVVQTEELIDKIKNTANLVVINTPDVIRNKTSLKIVCDYASDAGLSFFIFMVHPTIWNFDYNPITWVNEAKAEYGTLFLGYYLYDEPGGNQLDRGNFRQFDNTTMPPNYLEAANTYVYYLYVQMRDFIKTDKLVTSDYGLYWFDYEAGYDAVFGEFGGSRGTNQLENKSLNIALVRGAAEMHNKTWGIMITWAYENPPYIESGPELYDDMVLAYNSGAKYIIVFNYNPQNGTNGLLEQQHFDALSNFKSYVSKTVQNASSNSQRIAYVLPPNYGWGLRTPNDNIWGVWNPDNQSQQIWNGITNMLQQYNSTFDIVYQSPWTRLFARQHYNTLIYWNGTTREIN
jgi:hypothetical protein